MEVGVQFQRRYHVRIQRLLFLIGIIGSIAVLIQFSLFAHKSYVSALSHATEGSVFVMVERTTLSNCSESTCLGVVQKGVNSSLESEDKTEHEGMERDYDFRSDDDKEMDNSLEIDVDGRPLDKFIFDSNVDLDKSVNNSSSTQEMELETQLGRMVHVKESDKPSKTNPFSTREEIHNLSGSESPSLLSTTIATNNVENLASRSDNSFGAGHPIINERGIKPTSLSQMTMLLLRGADASKSMRPHLSSPRDRELQFARLQIENAPILRKNPELYASLFRNVSMFERSYELMERILKVYVYKEGDKPIFHQPHLRGIYASEGWFMKLIEGNKQFVARDPRKAHLFYLPFSSLNLRSALHQESFARQKDLEKYLKNYTDIIAKKYRFWNKARGADHFLVACHDWAPRITREIMGNCIRALCNANVARGFRIGKDISLPVTYIRTSQDPQKDLGGKPPSDRPIMAFFAGGMHGYVRPILLHYWENKEPDMKIFGPMPRDIDSKMKYREYMKSSKYCICARGYEVHTPRIVEAIYYGCVPVIVSDNYVPPFFEVLDWEAFSVFVLEKDIPNLRSILLSIPEEKYLGMQQRVKMVQQHFLWHKKPVKYDLFHMILHSVWYNRVFQVRL